MTLLLAPLLIIGCAGTTTPRQTCVKPLPDGVSLDSLADSTVPAAFTTGDIDWQHGKLTLTVYSETLYDTASINHMTVGDTLVYESKPMSVSTIERRGGAVIINGDVENGGACLTPNSGGTYRATTFDDYSVYTVKGKRSVDSTATSCSSTADTTAPTPCAPCATTTRHTSTRCQTTDTSSLPATPR